MFQAVKDLKSKEPPKPLLLQKDNNTLTTNQEEQVNLISNFFEKLFADPSITEIMNTDPTPMSTKFTEEEILKALKSLRNNKAAGV